MFLHRGADSSISNDPRLTVRFPERRDPVGISH